MKSFVIAATLRSNKLQSPGPCVACGITWPRVKRHDSEFIIGSRSTLMCLLSRPHTSYARVIQLNSNFCGMRESCTAKSIDYCHEVYALLILLRATYRSITLHLLINWYSMCRLAVQEIRLFSNNLRTSASYCVCICWNHIEPRRLRDQYTDKSETALVDWRLPISPRSKRHIWFSAFHSLQSVTGVPSLSIVQ